MVLIVETLADYIIVHVPFTVAPDKVGGVKMKIKTVRPETYGILVDEYFS